MVDDDKDTTLGRDRGTYETEKAGAGAAAGTARGTGLGTGVTIDDETKAPVTGFGPMRHWLNTRLRNLPGGAAINYGGNPMKVEEITVDGQVRLAYAGSFNLVPLDERYIPILLKQLIAEID